MCIQRKAEKVDVTEEKLVQSNIDSFGDDIGKTTNWITTMFDVKAQYAPDSEEYKELEYRIMCGQLYQQNAIDKAKGIICKPMPKEWYDRGANRIADDMDSGEVAKREFNLKILADKKPYFMRYIYPNLMSQYNTYIKNTNKKCMREFRKSLDELLNAPSENLSDAEAEFVKYYHQRMPVGMHSCVMNRICMKIENEFDNYFSKCEVDENFNYEIMKSGQEYTASQYKAIAKIYEQYTKRLQEYVQFSKRERVDEDEVAVRRGIMVNEFKSECRKACPDALVLCDIVIDLCYSKSVSKQFVWDICGEEIIINLLNKNMWLMHFPALDDNGDIEFCGSKFAMKEKEVIYG